MSTAMIEKPGKLYTAVAGACVGQFAREVKAKQRELAEPVYALFNDNLARVDWATSKPDLINMLTPGVEHEQ